MSLYHEAASILESALQSGESLKATVFSKKTWKSDAKTLYALTAEAAKWSEVLTEVLEKSDVLKVEKQLSPALAIVLCHDVLLSKKGLALPAKHGLAASILRHKARLQAELTKARIKRGSTSLEALRADINRKSSSSTEEALHPRWIRINSVKTALDQQLKTTFKDYRKVPSILNLWRNDSSSTSKLYYLDEHIPNVLALNPDDPIHTSKAYHKGEIILQDKASCFPAYLLDPGGDNGDVIDTCAAPGNKTTHLASIIHEKACEVTDSDGCAHVFACEKDAGRSETLKKMCDRAGAQTLVTVKAKQDFTKLNPNASQLADVTGLLLDPSCSGSGIVSRDGSSIKICLPGNAENEITEKRGKKRKRHVNEKTNGTHDVAKAPSLEDEEIPDPVTDDRAALEKRLSALADFQLRLLEHAMSFPAAKRISYSTCSIHATENEDVVIKALASKIAKGRGWRVLRREDQVEGLAKWKRRGDLQACVEAVKRCEGLQVRDGDMLSADKIAEACIRCKKGTQEGTMGFFLCGLQRDNAAGGVSNVDETTVADGAVDDSTGHEDEWSGFSDVDE